MKLIKEIFYFIFITLFVGIFWAGVRFLGFTLVQLMKVLWLTIKLVIKFILASVYLISRIIYWPFKNCFPAKGIDQMSGLEFENFCSKWLELEGYRSIKKTPATADYGIDIIAFKNQEKYGIQCKRYSGNVGVGAIQEVSAGLPYYDCQKAIVITNSKFTKNSIDLAEANDVLLIDGNKLNSSKACKTLTQNNFVLFSSVFIMGLFTLGSFILTVISFISYLSYLPLILMLFGICLLTLVNGILEIRNKLNQENLDTSISESILEDLMED